MRRGRDGEHRGNATRIVDRRIAIPAFGKDARQGRKMERKGIQAKLSQANGLRYWQLPRLVDNAAGGESYN